MSDSSTVNSASFAAMVLALAPALAVSAVVANAVVLAAALVVTLLGARLIMSAAEDLVSDSIAVPAYLVVVAVLVTIIDLIVQAYVPGVSAGLGLYLPMVVVSSLILEYRWIRNRRPESPVDVLRRGAVFGGWLIGISLIRELAGMGTITLFAMGEFNGTLSFPLLSSRPLRMIALAPGAFLVMGYLLALRNWRIMRLQARETPVPLDESTRGGRVG